MLPTDATILAGPVVRRVCEGEVAVWLALSAAASVSLEVYDHASGERVASGTADTLRFGERLHLLLVRARGHVRWGRTYRYELPGFELSDVSYPEPGAPSFVAPPADLETLRIVHGSCRLPHGEGADALAKLDELLAARAPSARPQHLLLSGDQVYVNNIAPEVLPHITALGEHLLGWQELLPDVGLPCDAFPTGTREALIRDHGGLLEYGDDSHLLGFGEICALYLMSRGPWAWPADLPDTRRGRRMRGFVSGLPAARRALANVSVMSIFDDHEVTDDWNLTLHWVKSVLSRPLGRRIVCNALSAYAIFQGWGNDPAQFDDGAGRALLTTLAGWRGDDEGAAELERLVGLPPLDQVMDHRPPRLGPLPDAVSWSYRYPAPRYDIVVPDQRMCRSFPGASETDPPALLSQPAMDQQLGVPSEKPVVFMLSSSALIPLPKPWYLRAVTWVTQRVAAWRHNRDPRYADVYGPDRGDGWQCESAAFRRLIGCLARSCRGGAVVALVGDIHIGSAQRVVCDAPQPLVMAQLTSSPMRKEHGGTRLAQRVGYQLFGAPAPAVVAGPGEASTVHIDYRAGDHYELIGVNHIAEVRIETTDDGLMAVSEAWWGEPIALRNRFTVPL